MIPNGVRDARAVVGGVLTVLLVGVLVTRTTAVDPLLTRILQALPSDVVAAIVEPDHPSALRPALQQLLRLPEPALPEGLHPVATLFLNTEHGVMPLALIDRAQAGRAGLHGPVFGGLVVIGDAATGARLRGDAPRRTVRPPAEGMRFLGTASPKSLRVLVRLPFLAERFPALNIPAVPGAVLAVAAETHGGRLALSGVIAGHGGGRPLSAGLITDPVPGSLLVIDGVAASDLLPPDLPPVLAALAQEAGIAAELADISRNLHDRPVTLVLQGRTESVPDIVVATRRNPAGDTELADALRALLVRRGSLQSARTEVLRSNGRSIRHQRPAGDRAHVVQETSQGPWRIVEAPVAAGTKDLVSAERDDLFVVGTSKDTVLALGNAIPPPAPSRGRAVFHLAIDGTLLRREPLVSHALQGVPVELRTWVETLRTLQLDVFDGRRSLRFFLTSEFASGALPRAF